MRHGCYSLFLIYTPNDRQARTIVAFYPEFDSIEGMDDSMLFELAEKLRSVVVTDDDYQLSGLFNSKQMLEGQFDALMERVMVQLECERLDGLSQRLKAEYEILLQAAADFDNSCAIRDKTDLQKQLHLIAFNLVPAIAQEFATLIEKIAIEIRNGQKRIKAMGTGSVKARKVKADKAKKPEKKFKTWKNSGDACFIIEDNRIKFHYEDEIKDLKLRNESRPHELLFMLSSGSVSGKEIKKKLCTEKTKPYNVVRDSNQMLNNKIAKLGFEDVPQDVEFIEYDETYNSYSCCLKIHHKEEFDRLAIQQSI